MELSAQPAPHTPRWPQRAGSAVTKAPKTGTFQKMIVENGSVTMDLDLNGLNGSSSLVARPVTLQFVIGANSFFPILVFNDLLRRQAGIDGLDPAGRGQRPRLQQSACGIRHVSQTARRRKTFFGPGL